MDISPPPATLSARAELRAKLHKNINARKKERTGQAMAEQKEQLEKLGLKKIKASKLRNLLQQGTA